jgi:hypothetical protein
MLPGFRTMKSLAFLIKAPFILLMLFVINLVTSPGHWWVQYAALGIGIAWFFALLRVIRGVILAGGLAALGIYLFNRYNRTAAGPAPGANSTRPPDIPTVPVAKG